MSCPNPETVVPKNEDLTSTPDQVLDALELNGVEHQTIIHEALYTVNEARTVPAKKPNVWSIDVASQTSSPDRTV